MKVVLMSLLVSAVTTWVTTTAANAQEDEKDCEIRIVVSGDGEVGPDGNVFMVKVGALGDGDGKLTWVTKVIDDDGRSEKSGAHRIVLRRIGEGKDHGWLGVSIGSVSEALADQLDLDDDGVLIQNVVEGSPADKGGLKVHDVILTIDGDSVEGKVGRAIKLVKQHKPDEEVDIVVLRNGKETELTVTLGSRGGLAGNFLWKAEAAPDVEFEDRVRTFGRVMRRGDDGEWSIEDLGDLKMLKDLPGNLRMFLPKGGIRSTQVFVEGGHKTVRTRVEEDGNVIVIEQDGDGEITVTRVDEDGNETENVYADADELQDADEEAFDLLEGSGGHAIFIGDGDGVHDFDFDFSFDSDEWKQHMGEWHEKMQEGLSGALEIQEVALERIHEALENLEIDGVQIQGLEQLKNLPELLRIGKGPHALRNFRSLVSRKPKHSFEVRADGTIEVTIRRGDSGLTQLFEDEDDLADRKPRLFEKYEKLMNVDEE
ncbi:MAG: PDZ domain-containing protein [Planctomycetes bacterium]|nr:PDZ domain-containing protein [Planctomycetota bacterium]